MRIRQGLVVAGLAATLAGGVMRAATARLADGTAVHVRLTADLLSGTATVGSRVDMEISQPVTLQGVVAIPAGAVAWGAVQDVRKGKSLRFDIEGVRLPNQEIIKLRCSAHKTNIAARDEIKVEGQVGGDLGAAKGSEYTAYLDQDMNVEVPGAPAAPAPAVTPQAAPRPAPAVTPAPAAVVVVKHEAPAPAPAPISAPPTPTPAPAPAPVAPAVVSGQPADFITVECFSDPIGADIMINDEYHGNTPSIIKMLPGSYQIEFRMMGYNPHSQPLNLTPGTGLRTVRVTLDKQQ